MNEASLIEDIRISQALILSYARQSLSYFLNYITIPGGRVFGSAAEPWQRELIAPMIPAFEGLAGMQEYSGPDQFMHILARGHSKSSLEAWLALWLLIASRRLIRGFILAADRDQGKIIIQAAQECIKLNPWLASLITVQRNQLVGPSGTVEVLPADVGSMYGLQGNLYICDEIVHWKTQAPWVALYTGTVKVSPALTVVLSNAGLLDSWQHELYLNALSSRDSWVVFHREGFLATWMTDTPAKRRKFENTKLGLPPSEVDRLYNNRWIDPAEEHDYLRRSEVEACESLGRALGLTYRLRGIKNINNYVVGIDYGPKKDRTSLAVVHQDKSGIIVVDRLDVWERSSGQSVKVSAVEDWVREVHATFRPRLYVLDEYQMLGTIEWMESHGYPVERFAFRAGHGNFALAQALRMLVADTRLAWYPGAGKLGDDLSAELIGLRVKRMPYGFRFDHDVQKHDDRAFSVGIAAMRALEFPFAESVSRPVAPPAAPPASVPFGR